MQAYMHVTRWLLGYGYTYPCLNMSLNDRSVFVPASKLAHKASCYTPCLALFLLIAYAFPFQLLSHQSRPVLRCPLL
jgi:hypothetical protein